MSERANLFRHFPDLLERLPMVTLGRYPTPVERLHVLPPSQNLWIKRDDLSAMPYGGNKVRKLEFLLARARQAGAERLITAGATGSHHALATTVYGTAMGFDVTAVLFPQPPTPHVHEVRRINEALGGDLRFTRRMEFVPTALLRTRLKYRRERCYLVPPGGSDQWGTLGYVNAGLELAEQISEGAMPAPDVIYVAAGTMGTAAGLAIGLSLAGLPCLISASRIGSSIVANRWNLKGLISRTLHLLSGAAVRVPSVDEILARIDLRHDQIGLGYGHGTAAGREAAALFLEAGIALDPTYTAKAAAALLSDHARDPDRTRLFWHTLSASLPEVRQVYPSPHDRGHLSADGAGPGAGV